MNQAISLTSLKHVRAQYTICVLAYALERYFDLLIEKKGAKGDGWTLARTKEELTHCRMVEISVTDRHQTRALQRVTADLRELLKTLGLEKCLKPV